MSSLGPRFEIYWYAFYIRVIVQGSLAKFRVTNHSSPQVNPGFDSFAFSDLCDTAWEIHLLKGWDLKQLF